MPDLHHLHRRRRPMRVDRLGALLLGLGLTLGAGGSVLALAGTGTGGCSGAPPALRVVTSPALASAVARIAGGDRCARTTVTASPSATAAGALSTGAPGTADVWIPDSRQWVELARQTTPGLALLPDDGTTLASSPSVIAMPAPMAAKLGWPKTSLSWAQVAADAGQANFWAALGEPSWGRFRLGLADVSTSAATTSAVLGQSEAAAAGRKLSAASFTGDRDVQQRLLTFQHAAAVASGTPADLVDGFRKADQAGRPLGYLSAAALQESDVVAYNSGIGAPGGAPPAVGLAAFAPADGAATNPVPYVVTRPAAADPARAAAAARLLAELRGPTGQATLTAAGFRTAAGFADSAGALPVPPAPTTTAPAGDVVSAAQSFFTLAGRRAATLAVMDISGSMLEPVPGSTRTKFDLLVNAALTGVSLYASDDQVGIWAFSTKLDGDKGYKELSPTVALDARGRYGTHLDDLRHLAAEVTPRGDTSLYETALAAYQSKTATYAPGRINVVVLFTDGKEDDPGDPATITLAQLITRLKQLYDPKRPVQFITIGLGSAADAGPLQQISATTHARSYLSRDPRDVLGVFVDAGFDAR